MSIISDDEILLFCDASQGWFQITSANDALVLKYDGGAATSVDVADGTYGGDDLAAALETAIDAAFSITSTVSYSASTRKFTIAVAAGHTIALTKSGSDAALTFGFTTDHAAAVSITSDDPAGDPTQIITELRDRVEAWAQSYCGRNFESQDYRERVGAQGRDRVFLKHTPVTVVKRIAIGEAAAVRVCNTNQYSTATAAVTSTGVQLHYNGTAESELTFAAYATLTLMVAAIAALGNGWSAALAASGFGSILSSELVECFGRSCINTRWLDLNMPDDGLDDCEVAPERGTIYRPGGFPAGFRNVHVDYTAGYSAAAMPDDLKLAIETGVDALYRKRDAEAFGLTSWSAAGIGQALRSEMPPEALAILDSYRRRNI